MKVDLLKSKQVSLGEWGQRDLFRPHGETFIEEVAVKRCQTF
jgi:hypothetical protein